MVDLWEETERQADITADRRSAPDRPSAWDENFEAARANAEHFENFNFLQNSRKAAINDRINDIYAKTGERMPDLMIGIGSEALVENPNKGIAKLRERFPDIQLLDPNDIENAAKLKSAEARKNYEELARRERTWGGAFGSFLGGMAGSVDDPANLLMMGINPSHTLGLVKTAVAWGGIMGTQRAVNEVAGSTEREEIAPGYIASGESYRNIAMAAGMGAIVGAGPKALGNVWSRLRHGEWPTGIKDAGNHVLSEAQIESTNALHGAAGEAEHRAALTRAMEQLRNGEPVRVGLDPDLVRASRELTSRLEGETPIALPIPKEEHLRLTSEAEGLNTRYAELDTHLESLPEGSPAAVETLARLKQVETELAEAKTAAERKVLSERRDELLTNTTPERLQAEAAPIEQRRVAQAEQANIEARLDDIEAQVARSQARTMTLGEGLRAASVGQRQVVPRTGDRRHWLATEMAMPTKTALLEATTPEALTKILQSPEHAKALQHDLEMEATAHKIKPQTPEEAQLTTINGVNIARTAEPKERMVTTGRPGEEKTQPLSQLVKEIEDLKNAADELEGCLRPAADQVEDVAS